MRVYVCVCVCMCVCVVRMKLKYALHWHNIYLYLHFICSFDAVSNSMQVYVHTNTHILRPSEDSELTGLKVDTAIKLCADSTKVLQVRL